MSSRSLCISRDLHLCLSRVSFSDLRSGRASLVHVREGRENPSFLLKCRLLILTAREPCFPPDRRVANLRFVACCEKLYCLTNCYVDDYEIQNPEIDLFYSKKKSLLMLLVIARHAEIPVSDASAMERWESDHEQALPKQRLSGIAVHASGCR